MRSTVIVRTTAILIALLSGIHLQAQYYFYKLTEENGLSDNRITCFLKDRTGFLWIGTRNGLNRYDGASCKVFKPSAGNSISNEIINDIVQDSTGKIWVATMKGLNAYDPVTGKWETMMPVNSNIKNDLPNYILWDLEVDEKNRIWIVSDVWELSVYDPATKKFAYFDWPAFKQQKEFVDLAMYKSIQKITRKNRNEWWLGTTIGLFSVNIQTGIFRHYGSGYSDNLRGLQYDPVRDKVYTVTQSGRLFCYSSGDNRYKEIKSAPEPFPALQWSRKADKKRLLLMPHPDGMLELNTLTDQAVVIRHQPTLSASLLPGGVNSVYTDNTGMVWAGTGNGISFYNSHNSMADFIPLTVVSDKESSDGMSAALYDETERKYYVTSLHSKELFIIDKTTGSIRSVKSVNGKPLSACTNICKDRRGNTWLLTETHVYRHEKKTDQFIHFPTPNEEEGVIFHDLIEDKKGDYWLATWNDGVYRCRANERSFYIPEDKDSIYAQNITALANDARDDAVWIGTFNYGIFRYDPDKKKYTNFTESDANPEYLQLVLIRDLETDTRGKLWAATYGAGLYVYRHGFSYEKSFSHLHSKTGLTQSIYYSMAADDKNRIWLLGAKGISAVDQDGRFLFTAAMHPVLSFSNYVPSLIFPKRIFFNRSENELLVPVAGGLLFYYPDKKIPPADFPVTLTDVLVNGNSILYDSSRRDKQTVTLPFQSNSLAFQFAALTYTGRDSLQYEYKLRASDAAWKPAGPSGNLTFPDLPPGDYSFMIRASDGAGHYSSNVFSFSFRIKPPFWKTSWFILLLILLAGFLLYKWIVSLRRKIKTHKILNYFATSLYGQNTVEDIFWDIAGNCISQLKFTDCVIYLCDHKRKMLVQKAAFGPKSPEKNQIINSIEIPFGKGITGAVAESGKAMMIADTSKDRRYIVDDERRFSEITVPILADGKVFGIIDSEHPRKNFYKKYHLRVLKEIAAICSAKVSRIVVEDKLRSKISRDLHDEIGSALSSINVLSKVALSKAGGNNEVENYLSKIKDSTYVTMENMSDIVWAINPRNDKLEALLSRLNEFAAAVCEAQEIELVFTAPADMGNITLDLARRKNMFLIVKEAVNNAVKYSGCSRIILRFEQAGPLLRLLVQDDGHGFDTGTVRPGNGLHNMKDRAAECEGRLTIQSGPGGTLVVLEMPIPLIGVEPTLQTG